MHSFRSRIVIASLLWTLGLLGFTHVIFILLARLYPRVIHIRFHTLLLFAILCMIAGVLQMRGAFKRFASLGAQLADVREGKEQRIAGTHPAEVQPLVTELNALLAHREETVRRALAKAGDLAHGLKTPLAVVAHEVDRLEASGQHDAAAAIRQQLERMQRQIDFHLAHARAAGAGATLGARANVHDSLDGLIRTLQRLYAGRGIAIEADVAPAHAARVQREDLDEMLGNLLDNACKWAKSRVTVTSAIDGERIAITVDDDGPGIDPAMRDAVLQRGVRADEAAPGSGLGLAIVRDLAEVYGGSIAIGGAAAGGVSARLVLPAAG